MIVVDASVAVKWFFAEPLAQAAGDILVEHDRAIFVPDLFLIEVTGTLVRRVNMDKTWRAPVEAMIDRFMLLWQDGTFAVRPSNRAASRHIAALAMNLGHPVRDCAYLSLAMELYCPLITADLRFADKARRLYDQVAILA